MPPYKRYLADENAQSRFGEELAGHLSMGLLVMLRGDLGAGKTTLVRGLLRGLGYTGSVRSPTFTLLESYQTDAVSVCHLDLYRLADMDELELLGIRDYLDGHWSLWVEWPQRAPELARMADIEMNIEFTDPGRTVILAAATARGEQLLEKLP
ncbi:MAG: tRNA (adenosine(37)-N6)-threonylcarbamoyltransferase complex ATPase subunit type 1 TsaE [Gammaproteobacteria bacterium]